MAVYYIDVYELWTSRCVTEADNAADALSNYYEGNYDIEDNSSEFVEAAEDYGIQVSDIPEKQVREELIAGGFHGVLTGIRDLTEG